MSAQGEPRGLTDAERFQVHVRRVGGQYRRVRRPAKADQCPGTGLDLGRWPGDSDRCPVCYAWAVTNEDGGLRAHKVAKRPFEAGR